MLGIPQAHEDDAQRALRVATELAQRVEQLPFGLRARSGICSGEVVAATGQPGTVAVIGEPVVAAERLARSAQGGEIRLAEPTWQVVCHGAHATPLADGSFRLRSIDAGAPAIRRRLDRPLTGREHELGLLRETFARVVDERSPELLTVLGEPGIGKSRLVAELKAIAGEQGTVLEGRCPPYGEGITFLPLREVVLQALHGRPADELAAMLNIPAFALRRVVAAVGLAEGEAGEDTDWAILQLIGALARVRPLMVVIDDAQWAEPALLDLLLDLIERLRDAPVLLIWIARPDLLERSSERAERGTIVLLEPLSAAASASLLAVITGGRLEPGEERRIAGAAGGNPLFLEQLVAYVGEGRAADSLPPALQALLAERLDRLDAAERSALALAAITGDAFEPGAVHALATGITRTEVEQACERLVERDLLVRAESAAEPVSLRFRHALIREVAYASLAKSARARLHERHAAWLAELGSRVPEADARVGFHLETAHRFAREIAGDASDELAQRAGNRLAAAAHLAHGRGDVPGEIGFLDRAVALLGGQSSKGAELLPDLVSALIDAGDSERAEALADRAVSVSASFGLAEAHSRALIERERMQLSCHPDVFDAERSMGLAAEAADTLRTRGDELGLARAEFLMCDLTWLLGDPVASYGHAQEMLALARRAGSEFDAATALTFMAWSLVEGPWPASEAIARCEALQEAAGERAGRLSLRGCRAVLVAMTGRYESAHGDMARARAAFGELRLDLLGSYLALLDAVAETLAGNPTAAERAVRDAGTMVTGSGSFYGALVNVDLAHALIAQGRAADVAAAVARIDTAPAPCDREWVVKRHTARAWLATQAGDHGSAVAEARAAEAAADGTALLLVRAAAHRSLAVALCAAGRPEEAAAAAGRALALDQAKGNVVAAATTRRLLASLDDASSVSAR